MNNDEFVAGVMVTIREHYDHIRAKEEAVEALARGELPAGIEERVRQIVREEIARAIGEPEQRTTPSAEELHNSGGANDG